MSELHVDSVTKRVGDRQVLNDVFISCKPGEIIGLLGRNGSGKSTLLKIIQGSLNADNKFVSIDNKKINSLFDVRKLVQYLPQAQFLTNSKSLSNNIQKKKASSLPTMITEMYWKFRRRSFCWITETPKP